MSQFGDLYARMSNLTRLLNTQGPRSATQAIQEALTRAGLMSPTADASHAGDHASWPHAAPDHAEDVGNGAGTSSGRFVDGSYSNAAGTRRYKVYIPGSYASQPMPLVVMLHGCTQDPDDFARGTQMNALAEEKGFLVVYPAQDASANSSKCWNWFNAIDQQRGQGEPSLIAGITHAVIEQYGIRRNEVFIAGLSAGGAMAVIMGNTYPDLYAAVGVHSGLPYASASDLQSALSAMRGAARRPAAGKTSGKNADAGLRAIPIIVFHGDRDTTVSPANGEGVIDDFLAGVERAAAKTPAHLSTLVEEGRIDGGHRYSRTSHHVDGQPVLAEHWLVHGAGHAWAGGSAHGSYTDAKGPDASREMFRFFSTQALRT